MRRTDTSAADTSAAGTDVRGPGFRSEEQVAEKKRKVDGPGIGPRESERGAGMPKAGYSRAEGVRELERCFEEGFLLHPIGPVPGSLDLIATLYRASGLDLPPAGAGADALSEIVGTGDHLVMVLVDGLGMNIFERLPENGFLKTHFRTELRAVYPSTTASALVSMYSLRWPAEHAVLGWHTYLPEHRVTATILPYTDRVTERPLGELGLVAQDVIPATSRLDEIPRRVRSFMPERLETGGFSAWSSRGTPYIPFRNLQEAVRLVGLWMDDAVSAGTETLTYLYVPQLDACEHRYGPHHDVVYLTLLGIDALLETLYRELAGRARLVVSADHGQIFVPIERQYDLSDDTMLLSLLETPPTGEGRNPIFHVRPGEEERFRKLFAERVNDGFLLITPDDAEELRLFGPGRLSPAARTRLGTFIGIALSSSAVRYFSPGKERFRHLGYHGGLSAEEMRVPLVVA